jgi:hypothetical protein
MGTATLRSILESTVAQIIKVNNAVRKPAQRKGEKKAAFRKTNTSVALDKIDPPSVKALFLKQNWVSVSKISERTRKEIIFKVSFFLNINFWRLN